MTALHHEAVALAADGWRVFPCEEGGKRPLVKGGFKTATSDHEQIGRWWQQTPNANIGGAIPAGQLGLDVDPRHGGDASLAALEAQHGPLPPTLTSRTGSGGRHIWLLIEAPVRQGSGLLGPGLDTRTSGHGYLILPPSIHACGQPYQWECSDPPAQAPGWLAGLLRPIVDVPPSSLPWGRLHQPRAGYGEVALRGQCRDVVATPPGQRNARLNVAAYRMGRLIGGGLIGAERVAEALAHAALAAGLSEDEAVATIRSGLKAGLARPVGLSA